MDDDYSTDLLLASLLSDNVDDDCDNVHTSTQVSNQSLNIQSHGSTVQQSNLAKSVSGGKAPPFDSLEDLLNATLSPSEEGYSESDNKTSHNTSLVNTSSSTASVVSKTSTVSATSVGLPPKFRNTFKPVEISDVATITTTEFHEPAFKSPSYVVASQASSSSSNNNILTDNRLAASIGSVWQQQHKDKAWNDSVCPPSKKLCSESHMLSSTKSFSSITATTPRYINPTTTLSGSNAYSNLLASKLSTQQQVTSHPLVSTPVSLNGVNSASNTNTTTTTISSNNVIDLKRLQETNLVSELQAASNKPISSASILHAIQVVQLNYSMLLQKLNQNIDDATAQEVKTKLMVLTHHYKQLAQQYQAKLSAEKSPQLSSNVPTTSTTTTTNTATSIGSVTSQSSVNQSTISNMLVSSVTAPFVSTVIDLTHDKSIKTVAAITKESCETVTAPATVQHLTNTTMAATATAAGTTGANISSYLQSIPSLAAYLLQNTEAQKQLTPVELQQLNQIRVNLLQEFQRRQVQNFLTSLPPDARPKNVNELKDMMKEKNFSIQVSAHPNRYLSFNVLM